MRHVAVMGAGGWGTALGIVAARAGREVRVWSRNAKVVGEINRERVNASYLAPHLIPEGVSASVDAGEVMRGAEVVILAAPSHATRELLASVGEWAGAETVFVSATKGVEVETGK